MRVINYQEKIIYLRRYRHAAAQVQRLSEELIRWRSLAEKVTTGSAGCPGKSQGAQDHLQPAVERIIELEQQLATQIQHQLDLRQGIGAAIDAVPDARLRQLLQLRYIDGISWEKVAVEMHYGIRSVFLLHSKALKKIALYCI